MKFDVLKTRSGKLKAKLEENLLKKTVGPDEIQKIIDICVEYEQDNLDSIEKLKRIRTYDAKKINGALRQTINAHSVITKELIGSATKRILGATLTPKKKTIIDRILNWLTNSLGNKI